MKRQAVWTGTPGDPQTGTSETSHGAAGTLAAQTSSLASDGQELAKRGMAYATRTLHENPALVLAGVVAFGAIAAMAVMPRKSEPASAARKLQRDLFRQTKDVRQAIRRELRDSGIAARTDEIGRSLSSIDWKPYLQPFLDQAAYLARQANEKLSAKAP